MFRMGHRIQQALTNLIVNAMHASPRGETVRVRIAEHDREARIDVIDRGSGIAQEDRGRLCEPFFTTKPAGEGTGLGLAIANEIVRDHGGTIEVDANADKGAAFSMHLPRVAA